MNGWIDAYALVKRDDQDEFEEACVDAFDGGDAIVIRHDVLHVQVDGDGDAIMLLLALPDDTAYRCRIAPGLHEFPLGWEHELRRVVRDHCISASVVPTARFEPGLRHRALVEASRAALVRRTPTFGQTYPRIAVA